MVGDPRSEYVARVLGAATWEYLPHFFAPAVVLGTSQLGFVTGVSNHASFWDQGYRALTYERSH